MVTTVPRSSRSMRLVGDDEPSDAALLVAVALGDAAACRVFVERHAAAVLGVATSVCRDRTLAEDIAQRAFEQAWRHAASFDASRATARTWLLVITRRLAIDELRRRRPSPVPPEAMDALLAPSGGDTERSGIAAAERSVVSSALADLPEAQRRAVVLATLGGYSASEVAEVEGVPLGTAKTRIRLGMRRLRAALAGEVDRD